MTEPDPPTTWTPGPVPLAVIMISLNEAHNMAAVLDNLKGFAAEVFLIDSDSADGTADIARAHGVRVVRRRFRGFGDQWSFAVRELPVSAPWTMKLDPDERLTDTLKHSIAQILARGDADAFVVRRRLWFTGRPLPVRQTILRGWRTGTCRFGDVLVNEHPLVEGRIVAAQGDLEHHDSPDLHHWVDKQNRYTTAAALIRFHGLPFAARPALFGTPLERRMWAKAHFFHLPFWPVVYFLMRAAQAQVWRTGRAGLTWARLRVWARRLNQDKLAAMRRAGRPLASPFQDAGDPAYDARPIEEASC